MGKQQIIFFSGMKIRFFLSLIILQLAIACGPEVEPETPVEVLPPTGVRLVQADATSLTFSWTAVNGAENYTARLEKNGQYDQQKQVTVNTAVFTGLETGAEYQFKVRVKTADGDSGYSEPLSVIPGESEPGPAEPDPEPDVPLEGYEKFRIPSYEEDLGALAFPGAEGGGMYVTGGRGGRVIHVTNLNDSGEGSLRAAVEASGTRTVVFDVAGRIDLRSELKITNGNLTIAGQTAPGDGICISGQKVSVDADNVIIRFMRFRLGTKGPGLDDGSDAIWGRYHENIILDHCSVSWSIDEGASFYANKNFTMQWCIISEALNQSGFHSKGAHGYGGIWGGRNASFHHNLLADNYSRNARIDHPGIYIDKGKDYRSTHRGNVDYRNNVIYNWGDNSTYGGEDGHFNIVGNYYKPGPASKDRDYFVDAYWYNESNSIGSAYPELYMEGNVHTEGINESKYPGGIYYHDQSEFGKNPKGIVLDSPLSIKVDDTEACYTSTHNAYDAFNVVLKHAGASLSRDEVDERVTSEAESGKASCGTDGIIDTEEDAGGWPAYEATDEELESVTDTDGDGMPDWFETEFGLNPSDASDGNAKNLDGKGRYTNLEMYLHYLVRDIVASQTSGSTYMQL